MIDFKALFKYLIRYSWLLLLVPVTTAALTFFLTRDLPDNFSSEARILAVSNSSGGDAPTARQFNYFVEMIRSKSMINVLSYRLIIHDLEHPEAPFTKFSEQLSDLSASQRQESLLAYQTMLRNRYIISPADNSGVLKLYDYIKSMGYHESDLRESLFVSPNDITGFIDVAFTSNNQDFSVYAVNALVDDFVDYYNLHLSTNNDSRRASLDSTIAAKRLRVNEAESQLNTYKLSRGVTGIGEQSNALYERVATYEQNLADNRRQITATKGAIRAIDLKIQEQDNTSTGQSNSSEIVMLDQSLKLANQRYVDGGFKPADKWIVDSLQLARKAKLTEGSRGGAEASKVAKAELLSQRRVLETELAKLENSTAALESEHRSLRSRLNSIMPADAELQRLQQELDLALEDYTGSVGRLNTVGEEGLSSWSLNVVMRGLPGEAQASKKIIYVAGAGFAGGAVCFALLFVLFLSDRSVKTAEELTRHLNGTPMIGEITNCPMPAHDFEHVWENEENNGKYGILKDQLRAIRFEVKKYLMENEGKIMVVSSLNKGDGKSFLASSLAYSFAISGAKVLLIGDSQAVKEDVDLAEKAPIPNNFNRFLAERKIKATELITFLKTNTNKRSLMELDGIEGLNSSFEVLKREFDFIIIDGGDLGKINEIKEWLYFADGCIAICSSGTIMDDEAKRKISLISGQEHFLGWVFNKSLKVG